MTVKLELNPDLGAVLQAQALERGISLESYMNELLRIAAAETTESARRKSLVQLFAESPWKGLDLKVDRDADCGRPVQL
jgi:hypothetical protein